MCKSAIELLFCAGPDWCFFASLAYPIFKDTRVSSGNAPFGIILYEMWRVDGHRWVRRDAPYDLSVTAGEDMYNFVTDTHAPHIGNP